MSLFNDAVEWWWYWSRLCTAHGLPSWMQVQEAIRLQNAQGYGCPIRRNKHRIALDLVFKVQTSYVVLRWALLLRRPEHFLGLLNTFSASWTSRGKVDFCTKRACISLARLTVMPQTSSVATWLFGSYAKALHHDKQTWDCILPKAGCGGKHNNGAFAVLAY